MLLPSNHLILSLFFFFCCLPVNFLLYSITGIGYYHTWFQWLVWCMCIASMPFVFLCSPQEVLCYRNAAAIIHSCQLLFHAPPNGYWCWCAAKIVPFLYCENFEKPVSGLKYGHWLANIWKFAFVPGSLLELFVVISGDYSIGWLVQN